MTSAMTSAGLTVPRLADIREAVRADVAADPDLGPSVQTTSNDIVGQILDTHAEREAAVWEALAAAYAALDPDEAEGASQDAVCAYAGVIRLPASYSTVSLTATGTPATVIPAGSIFRIPNGVKWISTAEATIGGGGTVAVPCRAESTGPIEAAATTITGIVTTIAGLSSVTNAADAVAGRDVETDAQLRVRREISLQRASGSTNAAIRARVLEVDDVLACVVLDNDTDDVDANGLPPHSFRVIVWPDLPNDVDIWLAIVQQRPSGIRSDGTYAGLATDSQGTQQTVRYSSASAQVIHVVVRVVIDANTYPLDGDTQIEDAVLAYGAALSIGDDVRPFKIITAIEAVLTGILDMEVRAKIGSTPGASDTVTIPISVLQIATFSGVNITVTQVSSI